MAGKNKGARWQFPGKSQQTEKKAAGTGIKIIVSFFVFSAAAVILSQWIGLFFLNTPLILLLSAIAAFLLLKKFWVELGHIPKEIFLISLIVAALCAYPLLLLHPYYPASNDAFHTIMVRTLQAQSRIPATFEPYSGISFTYPFGFHLLAKIFADILFFAPDFLVLWALGVLLAAIQAILVYFFGKEAFGSEKTGIYSAILFLGSKMVFQEMFFGIWSRLLAVDFLFLYLILLLKKNRLCLLFLPALAITHTGIFFCAAAFTAIFVLFRRNEFLPALKTMPSLLLAIPAIALFYAPIFLGVGRERAAGFASAAAVLTETVSVALWLGWVPLLVLGVGLLEMLFRKKFSWQKLFSLSVLLFFVLLYFLLSAISYPSANVVMEFAGFGAIFFGANFLAEFDFKDKKAEKAFLAVLALLCIAAFFSSGYLAKYMQGSKITPWEAEFAFEFRQYDPVLKEMIYLPRGEAKIAEFSNKIPFDVTQGFFLPAVEHIVENDSAWQKVLEQKETKEKIIESKCAECVLDLNVDYAVIDTEKFPALPGKSPVLEQGSLKLYKLR